MNAETLGWEWVRGVEENVGPHEWLDLLKRALEAACADAIVHLPDVYARAAYLKRTGRYPQAFISLVYATLAQLNDSVAPEFFSAPSPRLADAVGEIVLKLGGAEAGAVYARAGRHPYEPYTVLPPAPPQPDFRKLDLTLETVETRAVSGIDRFGNAVVVAFEHTACLSGKETDYWFRPGNRVLFHKLEPAGEYSFKTGENTLFVLEPDYLVNVTDMAEAAAQSAQSDILRRYYNLEPPRRSMLVGSMVNALLDEWLCNPYAEANDVVRAVNRQYAFALAYVQLNGGTGGDFAQTLRDINEALLPQSGTLQALVRRLHSQNYRIWLEPSFISPDYGLQGRMDVLLTEDARPEFKTIIELKAGKPPRPDIEHVRAEHHYQLTGYDMQLGDGRRVGNSCVFYSQEPDLGRATRTVSSGTSVKRTVLSGRNRLVRSDFRLCDNDYAELDSARETLPCDVPKYKEADAVGFHETLAGLSELELAYFYAFSGFVAREHRHAKIGVQRDGGEGHAGLWRKTLPQKCADFSALAQLEIDFSLSDPERSHYCFVRRTETARLPAAFRPDDAVVVYEQNAGPVGAQLLKATLVEIDADAVIVSLRNKQFDSHYLCSGSYWVMEHDFMEKSDRALYQSLFRWVQDGNEYKRRVFLGLERPRFDATKNFAPPAYLKRPEQIALFRSALAAKDYFLVQGPPGTGKTSLLLKALVDFLYGQTQETLALLAYTNRAADEICEQILALGLPFYRLGFCRLENVPTEKVLSRTRTPDEIHDFLRNVRIVVSTVASFANKLNDWSFKKFHTAIVDEASQLLEPHLCGALTRFERFILIGDEKQLPAVVAQPKSDRKPPRALEATLRDAGIDDLGRAVFDRILARCRQKGWHEAYGMLTAQGRMHKDVADFVGKRYYGGRLEAATERQILPFSAHSTDSPLSRSRVVFINVPAEKTYKINRREAELAAQIAKNIRGEVGIISPYRAQIAEIVRRLDPEIRPRVTVDTVERYQGSQREFILYSVCANYGSQLEFLSSLSDDGAVDRKLNVALTRAREQVVVLGNAEVLSRSPHYSAFIDYAKEMGGYLEDEVGLYRER